MSITQVATPIRERFDELKDDWKSKTRHLSNTAQISLVFSYQQIIGMGPAVVPLILAELEREPDHWFWALEAITGECPIPQCDAGDVEASALALDACSIEPTCTPPSISQPKPRLKKTATIDSSLPPHERMKLIASGGVQDKRSSTVKKPPADAAAEIVKFLLEHGIISKPG